METAKIITEKMNGEAVAPRTVVEAVTGLTEALDEKADTAALNEKQDKLTFDTTPQENSKNPVESGAVYTGLAGKADASALTTGLSGKQDKITVNGILKGNGSAVATATAGTDYIDPTTLQTSLGRGDAVTAANTSYGAFMARGIAAGTAAPQALTDGCIYLVYE